MGPQVAAPTSPPRSQPSCTRLHRGPWFPLCLASEQVQGHFGESAGPLWGSHTLHTHFRGVAGSWRLTNFLSGHD